MLTSLSTGLAAGLSPLEALTNVTAPAGHCPGRLARAMSCLISDGYSLADAFCCVPGLSSARLREAAAGATDSESLAHSIRRVAEGLTRKARQMTRLRYSLMYPAWLAIAGLVGTVLAGVYVLPGMTSLLEASQVEVPWATRLVVRGAQFMLATWPLFLASVALAGLFLARNRQHAGSLLARFPVLRQALSTLAWSEYCLVLTQVLESGMPVHRALALAGRAAAVPEVLRASRLAAWLSEDGSDLAHAASVLHPRVHRAVARGSGRDLCRELREIGYDMQHEANLRTDALVGLSQPLLTAIVASVTGAVAIAICLPVLAPVIPF